MNVSNNLKNVRIEFHILQSFPVTCLNRDDVGAPKTAVVGGSVRARVSSQCWKRHVRLEMNQLGVVSGKRTKMLAALVERACFDQGATEEQARACGQKIQQIFTKDSKKGKKKEVENEVEADVSDEGNDTLIFLSPDEISFLAEAFKQVEFLPEALIKEKDSKKQAKELEKLFGSKFERVDALDIALFGRMVAQAPKMNIEASASFAHAISTHKVSNEVEFFSALDDEQKNPGAGHLGSLEYNSATYYRYISLDLGQLSQTLSGMDIEKAVEAFVKALFVAVPSARQSTMSGSPQWDFAKIFIRKGQRLQLSFETPVQTRRGEGYLNPSIEVLKNELAVKEKRAGSLFGKLSEYTFGEDETSVDDLIEGLKLQIEALR